MNSKFSFTKSGRLSILTMDNLKLKDIEEFCAEARKLGLGDNDILHTSRQGLLGPIIGWRFDIPVIPANEVKTDAG